MKYFAYVLLIISTLFFIFCSLNSGFNTLNTLTFNPEIASYFGSFVGGILSPFLTIVSILLLLQNLKDQKKENKANEIRSHIFELLKYNRETVNDFEYTISYDPTAQTYKGSRFFVTAKRQIEEAITSISGFKPTYSKNVLMQIGYLIFYFGVGSESEDTLKEYLMEIVDESETNDIIAFFKIKKSAYNSRIYYYGGNQNKLAHYFRQLYFIISLIDENKDYDAEQQIKLSKILRVQLGNYEQAVLFYNSLTTLGLAWSRKIGDTKCLLEKYELIKNIQNGFLKNVNVKDIYPNIEYEKT